METLDYILERYLSEWEPLVRVGLLQFNAPIPHSVNSWIFRKDTSLTKPEETWSVYSLYNRKTDKRYNEVDVTVEDDLVTAVSLYKFLYFKGSNIVGFKIDDALRLLHEYSFTEEEFEVIDEIKNLYSFDDLGLVLWVDDAVVESASCFGPDV